MRQIFGTSDDFKGELPLHAEGFFALGRFVEFASLYRVTTRAAYYKEPSVPGGLKAFNREQR